MEQAVSAFGIPKSELRDAKRQGCDGFRNSRVQMDEVCRWIFSRRRDAQRTDGIGSLEDEQARQAKWRADLLELETREKEGELVNLSEVQVMLRDSLLPIRQRLLALPTECDTRANPSDPAHARAALQIWVDSALSRIREAVAEVVDPKPAKQTRKAKSE